MQDLAGCSGLESRPFIQRPICARALRREPASSVDGVGSDSGGTNIISIIGKTVAVQNAACRFFVGSSGFQD